MVCFWKGTAIQVLFNLFFCSGESLWREYWLAALVSDLGLGFRVPMKLSGSVDGVFKGKTREGGPIV